MSCEPLRNYLRRERTGTPMRAFLRTIILLAFLVLLLVAFHQPLLTAAARFLIVQDPLEKADVIVILSGGRRDERVRQAAHLYQEGYAPVVLLSGGEEMMGISIPELLRRQALAHGIPAAALLFEPGSTSTAEQARNLRPMLEGRGVGRAIIATSSARWPGGRANRTPSRSSWSTSNSSSPLCAKLGRRRRPAHGIVPRGLRRA